MTTMTVASVTCVATWCSVLSPTTSPFRDSRVMVRQSGGTRGSSSDRKKMKPVKGDEG